MQGRRFFRILGLAGLGLGGCLCALTARAATLTVTSASDSGAGTLRQAIADAGSGDTICFNLAYPATITLASTLTLSQDLVIQGPGSANLTVSGNNTVRVFDVTDGTVAVSGLTVSNGFTNGAGQTGAGIRLNNAANVTLDQCLVRNHVLLGGNNRGAALYVPSTAILSVRRSSIRSNTVPGIPGCEGAAVYTEGDLALTCATLSNNNSYFSPALCSRAGAGKTVALINVTVSGNTSDNHGAVTNNAGGAMTLLNCTITNNVSSSFMDSYEAGLYAAAGSLALRNSIVAGNLPTYSADTDIFFGGAVTFTSLGNNLIGSTGSQTYTWTLGDVVGTEAAKQNANLGALADNGGYVFTCAPNVGSQAIDPGSGSGAPFVDARGFLRNNAADKGAHEYGGPPPLALFATNVGSTSFDAVWNSVAGASGYLLDVATDTGFTAYANGYHNLDVGNVITAPVTGLTTGVTYYFRVRAYNGVPLTYYTNMVSALPMVLSPTSTPTLTASATPTPTLTASASATSSATRTPTPTVSATLTASASATFSATRTPTPTVSATLTASASVTRSATRTQTPTVSATLTASATVTPTLSASATRTRSATLTASASATPSITVSPTVTPSSSITATLTQSPVVSATPTATVSETVTPSTNTATPVPSFTLTPATATEAPALRTDALAYPNPARGTMHFLIHQTQTAWVEIHVYNIQGELTAKLQSECPAGTTVLPWNCQSVAPGIYFARVHSGHWWKTLKVAVVP